MPGPLSSAAEALVLDALLTDVFVSLHTADPGSDGDNEVTGGDYVRQAVTFHDLSTDPTVRANDTVVQFPVATAEWGTITYFGIWDAETDGTFLLGGLLTVSKNVGEDDSIRIPIDKLKIQVD